MDALIKTFDTPLDFLEWATHAPCLWRGMLSSQREGGGDWSGTDTYKEAYELAKYGWDDGLKKLTRNVAIADAKISTPPLPPSRRFDVAGFFPNPSRAAAGEIFNMVALVPSDLQKKPVLTIRISCSYACAYPAEKIMEWGAAICSYINQLELEGKSVQLEWAAESTPSCGDAYPAVSLQFPLKKAGDPLSLASVVFWIAHPAALRRIGLAALEKLDVEGGYCVGYGTPATIMGPARDTLYLTINDAGETLDKTLSNIRTKHALVLQNENLQGKAHHQVLQAR